MTSQFVQLLFAARAESRAFARPFFPLECFVIAFPRLKLRVKIASRDVSNLIPSLSSSTHCHPVQSPACHNNEAVIEDDLRLTSPDWKKGCVKYYRCIVDRDRFEIESEMERIIDKLMRIALGPSRKKKSPNREHDTAPNTKICELLTHQLHVSAQITDANRCKY